MFARCLSCYLAFPVNTTIERLPLGERIVVDPALGRLWVACAGCSRWTLQPIEERWEAIEDLEREIADRAHLLGRTDNVALFGAGDVEIVRVGSADRREQAWWRYGREFASRRTRAQRVARRGKFVDAAIMFTLTGLPIWALSNPDRWINRARRGHFGRHAWRGVVHCLRCGSETTSIGFRQTDSLIVSLGPEQDTILRYACRRCGADADGGYELTGTTADHVLRRVLAWRNFAGADAEQVATALRVVERRDTLPALLCSIPEKQIRIGSDARLPELGLGMPSATLPLEILLNADLERRQLEMELADIEARWREEEELAAIIDRELTPPLPLR